MNQINLNNYEAYLLDFSEGHLSEEMQMDLELFLIQHPELGIDLSDLSFINVDTETFSFEGKQHLKKSEKELISETQFINYIEGLSGTDEKTHIEKSCALNPKLGVELELYKKTLAEADKTIVYPAKTTLKRKPKVIWLNLSARHFAAAASVLFILGLIFLWPKTKVNNQESILAKNDTVKTAPHNNIPSLNDHGLAANSTPAIMTTSSNKPVLTEKNPTIVSTNNPIAVQSNPINTVSVTLPEQVKNESINTMVEGITQNKNEIASNNAKSITVVETITENDDEYIASDNPKKKKGIWAIAGKTLKSLNSLGVKSVDGEEAKNSSYALTLGGLNITHKSAENL